MALTQEDIRFFKSKVVTDTGINGGAVDLSKEIISNVRYNLFPKVGYLERVNGKTRFRKMFVVNTNADNDVGYNALFSILKPSNADDSFFIRKGDFLDTQADIEGAKDWVGCGQLYESVSAGATQLKVLFDGQPENPHIPAGGQLVIGKYNPGAVSEDNLFLDVFYLPIKNEVISVPLGDVPSDRILEYSLQPAEGPISAGTIEVSYSFAGTSFTARDDGEGQITGPNLIEGETDYETYIRLYFSGWPDSSAGVIANYALRPFTQSGNVFTIFLSEGVPIDFTTENTYVGVALDLGDLKTSIENLQINSANGTLQGDSIELQNYGTEYDVWTLTFTGPTSFNCTSLNGFSQSGAITTDFAPLNPTTNTFYFRIPASAWGGAWLEGDTVSFITKPAASPVWWKEVVPANAGREPNNIVIARVSVE